jgi:ribonuclease III
MNKSKYGVNTKNSINNYKKKSATMTNTYSQQNLQMIKNNDFDNEDYITHREGSSDSTTFSKYYNNQDNNNQEDDIHFTTEEIRDRILNEKNIYITEDYINGIFKRFNFDHTVKNLENFQMAMVHSSYLEENVSNPKTIKLLKDIPPIDPQLKKKCMQLRTKSYERIEFLGDSVIRHAIGKYLFLRYPNEEEGFLTTNRSKMENKFALSSLARKLGLQNYAVISKTIELANGRTTYVTLTEDIFEAFIGALNLEIDENKTIDFVWSIIEKEGDVAETIRTQNNYKDQLMQYFHKMDVVKHDLQYNDTELETDDGRRRFSTVVIDKNTQKRLGIGSGRSKKTSQQRAAKDALIKLGLIGNDKEVIEYFDNVNVDDITKELNKVKCHVDKGFDTNINCTDINNNHDYDYYALATQNKHIKKKTQK